MSLETLLEAAEFLESREQGSDIKANRQLKIVTDLSGAGTSSDGSEISGFKKEGRNRTKSGSKSLEPLFEGSPDNCFYTVRAGTREVHNKLEKNRRAHLKECFDFLKKNIPSLEEKRTSNLGILRSSLRYIQNLKRKEREFELEMHRFVHQKILLQEKITSLKGELNKMDIDVDVNALAVSHDHDNETNSTSTATERGTPPPSDHDENDDDEEEAEMLAMETNSPTLGLGKAQLMHTKKLSDVTYNNIIHNDIKLPPKKAVIQSLNGIMKAPHLKAAALPSQTLLTSIKSEGSGVPKKVPVFPITVSLAGQIPTLAGQIPTQAITMLSPLTHPASFDIGMAAGKLVEIQKPRPPVTQKPRPPVTQILHQTLTQRSLQKQSNTTVSQVTSAPLTAAQLKSPPLSQTTPLITMTTQGSLGSLVVKDGVITVAKAPTAASYLTQQPKLTNVSSAIPTSMTFPYYLGSLQKFAHPVLVTSLMAPAVGIQTSSAVSSAPSAVLTTSTPNTHTPSLVTVKKELPVQPPKQSVINLSANSATRTLNNLVSLSMATPSALKTVPSMNPPLTVAGTSSVPIRQLFAPGILPGQLAWPFLTLPRSPLIVPTSSIPSSQVTAAVVTTTVSTATGQITSHPLVSLANLNQLTQMMTPMTVMSPGIQVTPTALTQAQLGGMFGTPLLKQLQLPLGIQTSLLPTGQVLGQQLGTKVVVVTVPTVVATTSSLPSNNTLVTSSSL